MSTLAIFIIVFAGVGFIFRAVFGNLAQTPGGDAARVLLVSIGLALLGVACGVIK
jgi:hypothetical protein